MTEHIRINAAAPRIQYVADGTQTAFPYPFAIFHPADLEVLVGEAVQPGGYTVSGAGTSGGGAVDFAVPPPAGARITLRRRLALQRTTDFQPDGIIRAKTLNDELDYQAAALQQLDEEIGRSIRRSPGSASTADLTLPEPAPGRGLKWNAAGTALVNSAHDPDSVGNATGAAEAAIAARDAAEAARDQAQAAAGGVRVSADDPLAGQLAAKLAAGPGITLAEEDGEHGRRLVIGTPQTMADRLSFLELNLALNTLRDQIDAGWSVLRMVDGWADEFEDQTGVDTAASTDEVYDPAGAFYKNVSSTISTGYSRTLSASTQDGGQSIHRNRLAAGTITITGSRVRIRFKARGDQPMSMGFVYFGPAGTGAAFASPPTKITFNGGASGFSISAGQTIWSDWITMSVDASTAYIISSASAGSGWNYYPYADTAGVDAYILSSDTTEASTSKLDAGGYSLWSSGRASRADAIEVETIAGVTAMALLSNPVLAAQEVPTEARLVLLHQPVDPTELNTDIIAEISRDGGTTWTAGSLVDEGAFDATANILSTLVDLSGQPAGTAMRWRVRTLNQKSQRLHGVWLQWR